MVRFVITIFVIVPVFCIYMLDFTIKKHFIKKMLLHQKESIEVQIPNGLQVAKHADVESFYSLNSLLSSSFLFVIAFIFLFVGGNQGLFLQYFLIGTIVFCLLDIIVYRFRKSAGFIQGTVLFNPKEKKIYAFPTIDSNNYNVYRESELVYTVEKYSIGRASEKAYVFFSKKDNRFAFKVKNLEENGFGLMLSQKNPIDMSIPFEYRFHTIISACIAIILSIVGFSLLSHTL